MVCNNEDLPDHCLSMRKALDFCREQLQALANKNFHTFSSEEKSSSGAVTKTLLRRRREALETFWRDKNRAGRNRKQHLEVIDFDRDECPPCSFRRRFLRANLPCLVRGERLRAQFSPAISKWTKLSEDGAERIFDHEWFERVIGIDTVVPVCYQPWDQQKESELLDEEGRAKECESKEMRLSEWIELLATSDDSESSTQACGVVNSDLASFYYLKDWHLVLWLSQNHGDELPLYHVPEYFQQDLLNNFLTHFTSGDYRFVYWGPKGSRTTIHSDVLNSFSWSFNVHGTKEWTFFPPEGLSDDTPEIVVTQYCGDCMFVPAGWKHQVVNLETCLSINHNWITTTNMDLTWDCLMLEMEEIEEELKAWDIDSWEAKESMLRGCTGLDVTAVFFMALMGLLETLSRRAEGPQHCDASGDHFDIVRLGELLTMLIEENNLGLQQRLVATLQDVESALEGLQVAKQAMDMIIKCFE